MIPSVLRSAQRRWDRRLNLLLMFLWGLVAWRTGLVALGYSVLALIGDLQALLGPPLPDTLQTRHPSGLMVDVSVAELRRAWWIAPHLAKARQLFVLGAVGSILFYLLKELLMLRHRARYDPVLNARINDAINTAEVAITQQAPAMLIRAGVLTLVTVSRLANSAQSRPARDLVQDPEPQDQSLMNDQSFEVSSTADCPPVVDLSNDLGPDESEELKETLTADESEPLIEANEDPPATPAPSAYPTTFFTQF